MHFIYIKKEREHLSLVAGRWFDVRHWWGSKEFDQVLKIFPCAGLRRIDAFLQSLPKGWSGTPGSD